MLLALLAVLLGAAQAAANPVILPNVTDGTPVDGRPVRINEGDIRGDTEFKLVGKTMALLVLFCVFQAVLLIYSIVMTVKHMHLKRRLRKTLENSRIRPWPDRYNVAQLPTLGR